LFDCGFGEITDWGTTRLSVTTNRYYVELVFCKQGLKALGRTVSIFFQYHQVRLFIPFRYLLHCFTGEWHQYLVEIYQPGGFLC